MSKRSLAYLLLLGTVLVWGATFPLVKLALADASPLLFNLLRMAIATVVLAVINHRRLARMTRAEIKAGALAGLFLAIGYQLQTLGLEQTSPAKSAFITSLVVVFVPALTIVRALRPVGSPRPGFPAAAGALLAFIGLFLITTPTGTGLANLKTSIGSGDLLTLVCALAFAAHLLTLARFAQGMSAGLLASLQIAFATVTMLFTLPFEHSRIVLSPSVLVALAICSLAGTAAAFTIQSFAQQVLPPTHTVLLLTLEPVFAWLTGLLLLHDVLNRRALLGAGFILAGIMAAELLPAANTTAIPV